MRYLARPLRKASEFHYIDPLENGVDPAAAGDLRTFCRVIPGQGLYSFQYNGGTFRAAGNMP